MMICHEIEAQDVIERYLSGGLSEAEQQTFEDHYFECADCFERLKIARALHAKSESRRGKRWALFPPPGRWRSALLPVAALVAVALLGTLYWNLPRSNVAPLGTAADAVTKNPPAENDPAEEKARLIAQLGRVDPAPYAPTRLRETEDQTRMHFDQAMSHYRKGDYLGAIDGLQNAVKFTPQAVDVNFYLGACYLLTNQPEKAIDPLEKAISPDAPDYSEQAHYYLAKAYLQVHNLASARTELKYTLKFHGPRENEATQLLQELDKLH